MRKQRRKGHLVEEYIKKRRGKHKWKVNGNGDGKVYSVFKLPLLLANVRQKDGSRRFELYSDHFK